MKITARIKLLAATALTVLTAAVAPMSAAFAATANTTSGTGVVCPANAPQNALNRVDDWSECGLEEQNTLMSTVQTIINVVIGVVGFVTVVVIILGGVQYTTSAGEAGKVKKAKDTIMYGIIGLIVALLAYAIVNFILSGIFKTS